MAEAPIKVTASQIVPRASIMGPGDVGAFDVLLGDGVTYQTQGMTGDAVITGVKAFLGTMAFQDAGSVNITGGNISVATVSAATFTGGAATFSTTQVGSLTVTGVTTLSTVQIGSLTVTSLAVSGTSILHTTQVSGLTATILGVSGMSTLSTTQIGGLTTTSLVATANSILSTTQIGGLLSATGAATVTGALSLSGASSPVVANGDAGTAGYLFQSAGAGATPTWVPAPAGVNPAALYILATQATATTVNNGDYKRVTSNVTITIGTLSSTQSCVLARDTTLGAVFVNCGAQTIDGDTSFNMNVNKPIVLFECTGAGTIVTRLIGYLPSP